jgi:hypothetical protein
MSAMPPPNPYENTSQPPAKKGMSGCTKLLIVFGILGAICVALCCGVSIYFKNYAEGMVSEEPSVVKENTDKITDINIPDGLEPKMSMNMTIPVVGTEFMRMVVYSDQSRSNSLILAGFSKEYIQGQDGQNLDQQFKGELNKHDQGTEEINVTKSEELQRTIRGKEATFVLAEGEGRNSKTPRLRVEGNFEGKIGPSMILINVDADDYSREELIKTIDSIK